VDWIRKSVAWEVHNAISLDAARTGSERKALNPTDDSQKKQCAKCGKKGHTTAEHKSPEEMSKKKERDEDRRKKRCFDCKKPWKPGHKCGTNPTNEPENNNMQVPSEDEIDISTLGYPDMSMGSQYADFLFDQPEANVTQTY